jgi:hypothetical protein
MLERALAGDGLTDSNRSDTRKRHSESNLFLKHYRIGFAFIPQTRAGVIIQTSVPLELLDLSVSRDRFM